MEKNVLELQEAFMTPANAHKRQQMKKRFMATLTPRCCDSELNPPDINGWGINMRLLIRGAILSFAFTCMGCFQHIVLPDGRVVPHEKPESIRNIELGSSRDGVAGLYATEFVRNEKSFVLYVMLWESGDVVFKNTWGPYIHRDTIDASGGTVGFWHLESLSGNNGSIYQYGSSPSGREWKRMKFKFDSNSDFLLVEGDGSISRYRRVAGIAALPKSWTEDRDEAMKHGPQG